MKIVFIGDIVGKEARQKFIESIPDIKNEYEPDVLIVNAENAAAGFGLTKKIANQLVKKKLVACVPHLFLLYYAKLHKHKQSGCIIP